ncbi:hypothetical protein JCM12298_09460 [Desulfothermus naphthae]
MLVENFPIEILYKKKILKTKQDLDLNNLKKIISQVNLLYKGEDISEQEYLKIMSFLLDIEYTEKIYAKDKAKNITKKIPIHYLKKYPIFLIDDNSCIKVYINDPFNFEPLNDISALFNKSVIPILCTSKEILDSINYVYGEVEQDLENTLENIVQEDPVDILRELEDISDLLEDHDQAPIVKLVNQILTQAVRFGASDVHFEPFKTYTSVRYRLDGVLYNQLKLSPKLHPLVISRIKVMAKLNIAEKRLPQDGRIEIKVGDRSLDLRVSTMPTAFGERVVLRLLEKGKRLLKLDEIGLNEELLDQIKDLITITHGIILVTGPTGSGKTTTLYAALQEINTPDKNILTIEDPIEYQINGISQTQVNPKIGLTFAKGLRTMVRQDPDVILVGEIRDSETAKIAIQAALTGHLVLSTLHTNDAPSAITRLVDMGIEPFLVSSAVRAIIAQRLIRTLCENCKEEYTPSLQELKQIGANTQKDIKLYRPGGCDKCINTGFKGRTGVFELLNVTKQIQSLLLTTYDSNIISQKAREIGMKTLKEYAIENLLLKGKTSLDEVIRISRI